MSFRLKLHVVVALLAVSFAWPAAHYFVVRHYGLNPWNWWGWAMYTMPAPRVQASAVGVPSGRNLDLRGVDPQAARAVREAYNAFSGAQMELGGLRTPEDFATAVLRAYPQEPGVRIVVRRVVLDRESAMVEPRENPDWVYEYTREELGL